MLVCHDLVWVGTSAGVILTIPTPHLTPISSRLASPPVVTGKPFFLLLLFLLFKIISIFFAKGIPHGHTGHVRFLTCVEATPEISRSSRSHHHHHHHHPARFSLKSKTETLASVLSSATVPTASSSGPHGVGRLFVISGGDGYEGFRQTGFSDSVGREDSTNHLLLWQV